MTGDPQEIRRVLREAGEDVPDKGNLSRAHRARYDEITGANGHAPGPGFPEDEPGPAAVGAAMPEETRPVRPGGRSARSTARQAGGWLRSRGSAGGKDGGKGKAKPTVTRPRISLDGLISDIWGRLGKIAEPVSLPCARTMTYQAPVAGILLEDTVRGTVVDRLLQPLARNRERGKTIIALAGPPVLVLAIERAQGIQDAAFREMRTNFYMGLLEDSLLMWRDVAGDKLEEAMIRAQQREADRADVRDLIRTIFLPPQCPEFMPIGGGQSVRCIKFMGHDGDHSIVSEDQAAAHAQQHAGATL